ncbi:Protein CBG21090 [Caenorhabditis briggsae]|uniref:Protein CBG21090 n=1 Tax=Caenorhabditis briggsae TaxID=6238 RepID=A8XZI0_CAEBR|nr:Protein CBG21090 [Caenorhabditis briggsae]CAP38107.2 Protein CBG21090 [Caenorhabditis briggsae]
MFWEEEDSEKSIWHQPVTQMEPNANGAQCIKSIKKPVDYDGRSRLISEIQILKKTKSPFLCEMYECFETPEKVFLVLELLNGGELYSLIKEKGPMKRTQARYYLAQIALGLEYLHESHIMHRDLKSSNVMISRRRDAKIADFGLSKMNFPLGAKTKTFGIGTLDSMAPEMIRKEPYGHEVDYWALGVLAWEMLVGESPFNGKTREATKEKIKNERLEIPMSLSHMSAQFLKGLLTTKVEKRFGIFEIKKSNFFGKIDWEMLKRMEYRPPFNPKLKDDSDISKFDPEITLYENPWKTEDEDSEIMEINKFKEFDHPNGSPEVITLDSEDIEEEGPKIIVLN